MDNEINFEEFNIPDWAARLIGTDEDGYLIDYAQLMTRDGRRTGNAVIRKVEPLTEWVITVLTDMGNELVLTRREADELFFEPVYVMKADAVGVRLGRQVTPDTPKAECTNSDTWNCKYCRKTQTCEALNDPRNFGGTVKPERRLTGEMIYKALRDSGLTRYHQPDSIIQGDYEKCLERFAHSIFNLN